MMATRPETVARVGGAGERILRGHRRFAILPFLGPAFIACIAYIDPGNFATNIAAGSKFGYMLLWVIVASNLMAMLIQTLSAKLGIATGRNLPEVCRERFSHRTTMGLWIQAEFIAMATDLAEFLGAALGFNLLLGIGLFPAAVLTGIAAFGILSLQRFGFRPLEAAITAIVGVIGGCYVVELFMAKPPLGPVVHGALVPQLAGSESLLLAVGILGATVMPHVIYLHSALLQDRVLPESDEQAKLLYRFTRIDVVIAMSIAGLINMAMLIMAATTFHANGLTNIASIQTAYQTLTPILGAAAATIFALALVFSGLSSSAVGTYAGQVIMQGFTGWSVPLWVRRLATMVPAFVVIALGLNPTRTLVLSQVILSFGIPFALIPLVVFTSRRDIMGVLRNHRGTTVAASVVAGVIISLNVFLIAQTLGLA